MFCFFYFICMLVNGRCSSCLIDGKWVSRQQWKVNECGRVTDPHRCGHRCAAGSRACRSTGTTQESWRKPAHRSHSALSTRPHLGDSETNITLFCHDQTQLSVRAHWAHTICISSWHLERQVSGVCNRDTFIRGNFVWSMAQKWHCLLRRMHWSRETRTLLLPSTDEQQSDFEVPSTWVQVGDKG